MRGFLDKLIMISKELKCMLLAFQFTRISQLKNEKEKAKDLKFNHQVTKNKMKFISLNISYVHKPAIDWFINCLIMIAIFYMWFVVVTVMYHLDTFQWRKDLLLQLLGVPSADSCQSHQGLSQLQKISLSKVNWDNWHLIIYWCGAIKDWPSWPNGKQFWRTIPVAELLCKGLYHRLTSTGVHPSGHSSVNMPHTKLSLRVSFQKHQMCDHVRFTFKYPLSNSTRECEKMYLLSEGQMIISMKIM